MEFLTCAILKWFEQTVLFSASMIKLYVFLINSVGCLLWILVKTTSLLSTLGCMHGSTGLSLNCSFWDLYDRRKERRIMSNGLLGIRKSVLT